MHDPIILFMLVVTSHFLHQTLPSEIQNAYTVIGYEKIVDSVFFHVFFHVMYVLKDKI